MKLLVLLTVPLAGCLPPPIFDGATDSGSCDEFFKWYQDADGDGHGDVNTVTLGCPPDGYVDVGDDCDDTDPAVWEGVEAAPDSDGDGYGVDDQSVLVCGEPGEGWATDVGDCDDTNAQVNPGEDPVCGDVVDNDCDGITDCDIPEGVLTPDAAGVTLTGADDDELGWSVAAGADLTGDGVGDLVAGAPRSEFTLTLPGRAFVLSGTLTGEHTTADATEILGASRGDGAGTLVASGGDLDGDGSADLVLGALRGGAAVQGAVYGVFGPISGPVDLAADAVSATLVGQSSYDEVGAAVLGTEDLIGADGVADLIVGAPSYSGVASKAGAIYLYPGPAISGSVALADFSIAITGTSASDKLGGALASLGDTDGDGIAEIVVGASGAKVGEDKNGAVYVVSAAQDVTADVGTVASAWIYSPLADIRFGAALSGPGDVDDDGLADLIVGAPGLDAVGGAFVLGGDTLGQGLVIGTDLDPIAQILGDDAGEEVGASVAGVGDLDSDGRPDLCVGAPGHPTDDAGASAGSVYCYYGRIFGVVDLADADFQVVGDAAYASVGTSVGSAGDWNGVGVPDLIFGAPSDADKGLGASAAYILLADGY